MSRSRPVPENARGGMPAERQKTLPPQDRLQAHHRVDSEEERDRTAVSASRCGGMVGALRHRRQEGRAGDGLLQERERRPGRGDEPFARRGSASIDLLRPQAGTFDESFR